MHAYVSRGREITVSQALRHNFVIHVSRFCRRQREKAIHVLEVAKDGHADVTAVKEYVRAGAGHLVPSPDDLRPPAVLAETMEYLIRK